MTRDTEKAYEIIARNLAHEENIGKIADVDRRIKEIYEKEIPSVMKEKGGVYFNVDPVLAVEDFWNTHLLHKSSQDNKVYYPKPELQDVEITDISDLRSDDTDTEAMTELLEQIERDVEAGRVEINLRPHFDINESVVNRVLDFLKNKGIDASIGVIRNRSELRIVIEPKQCFEIKGHELEFDNHHLTLLVMGVLDKVPESILAQGVDSVIEFIGNVL